MPHPQGGKRHTSLKTPILTFHPNYGIYSHCTATGSGRTAALLGGLIQGRSVDLPEAVVADIGNALGVAQFGGTHASAKPWKGQGPGVFEIVEDFDGNAYRAVYTVRFKRAVYVLHAFQKKSHTGRKTPLADLKQVERRLKAARERYEADYGTDES